MRGMRTAAITALWGINAWYVANFATLMTHGPDVGLLAGVLGATAAYVALTRRRGRVRTAATAPAAA